MNRVAVRTYIIIVDTVDTDFTFRRTTMDFEGLDVLKGCNSVYSCQDSVFPMWF